MIAFSGLPVLGHAPCGRAAMNCTQACPKGLNPARAIAARELKQELFTEILAAPEFWPAEDYHQDYYKKNPARCETYRKGCGRDARVRGPAIEVSRASPRG